RGQK
ncbi:hybrid peroxiredoxin hyPrx5, partial [Vibrio parahaemolyticus V-223/04]